MGSTIQIMVKLHYKCCSRDNEEVETEEEDNDKQIVQQLPAIDDKISEESFKTTIPYNFKKTFIKIVNNLLINHLALSFQI